MTRAMFVTVLGRYVGAQAEYLPAHAFKDVDDDAYYAPYVTWAVNRGVFQGHDRRLRPRDNITRAEVAQLFANIGGKEIGPDTGGRPGHLY